MPERHTVMDIPRSHFKIQNIIILVTTGVGSIGKDLLMLTFMEPAAVRVRGADLLCDHFRFLFFFFQWLLSVFLTIPLDFFLQFFLITACFFSDNLITIFMRIGTGFDVSAVNKQAFCIKKIICCNLGLVWYKKS